MPSRFLSSCRSYTQIQMKDWWLVRDVCLWHMLHTQGRDAHQRHLDFHLHVPATQNKNARLVVTQGRDAHLCFLAFYLHVLIFYKTRNERWQSLRDAMLPEDSETVLSTLRTLVAVPPYLSPQFFSSSLSFCFSHDSLLLGAP